MKFIKTSDSETAENIRSLGFQELPKEGKFFVFINETGKLNFANEEKIVYTNKLSI